MQEQQWTIATSAEKLSDIKENLVSVAWYNEIAALVPAILARYPKIWRAAMLANLTTLAQEKFNSTTLKWKIADTASNIDDPKDPFYQVIKDTFEINRNIDETTQKNFPEVWYEGIRWTEDTNKIDNWSAQWDLVPDVPVINRVNDTTDTTNNDSTTIDTTKDTITPKEEEIVVDEIVEKKREIIPAQMWSAENPQFQIGWKNYYWPQLDEVWLNTLDRIDEVIAQGKLTPESRKKISDYLTVLNNLKKTEGLTLSFNLDEELKPIANSIRQLI
jgi:hypothetical protein